MTWQPAGVAPPHLSMNVRSMARTGCSEQSFRVVATLDSEEENICLCLSRNGDLLSGHQSKFKVWSCATDHHKWTLLHVVPVPEKGDVTSICQFPEADDNYAVSFNNCVAIYALTGDHAFQTLQVFHFNCDEVNQIDINTKASFICAGDDSGDIKVIDIENSCLYKTLARQHNNICSTVKFNPRKPWEIFSGGLDCQIIRWDFSRGRPLSIVDLQTPDSKDGLNDDKQQSLEGYMVNPPMVHSIDVFGSIHCVVCGLGNGSVSVYSSSSPKRLEKFCSAPLHTASVGCVCCVQIPRQESLTDNFIVSGGNDGKICVSRLRYEKETACMKTQKKQASRTRQALCEIDLVVTIEHGSKVNWVAIHTKSLKPTKATTLLPKNMLRIVVADQTSAITAYNVDC